MIDDDNAILIDCGWSNTRLIVFKGKKNWKAKRVKIKRGRREIREGTKRSSTIALYFDKKFVFVDG